MMLVSPTLVTNEADKKQAYKQLLSLRPKIIPSMKEKRKTQALAKLLLLHSNVKKLKIDGIYYHTGACFPTCFPTSFQRFW